MNPENYTIIAALFPRLLGAIYFCAIGALLFQYKGLFGKNGILPLTHYLNILRSIPKPRRYYYAPTLFWINSSDRAIMLVLITGVLFSILLMFGIVPPLMLLCLYVIHLSIISAGQDFLSFGWEGFLLEITVQAFLLSLTIVPNLFVWLSINFLLFRFHIQAGMIKLQTHDPTWRNLTAVSYHYQTQPIPNTVAWYFHKLPLWFQKFSNGLMFILELVVPFGIFFSEDIRFATFCGLFGLQFLIWFTGNFSYLNHMTAVLTTILISNKFLSVLFTAPSVESTPLIFNVILSIVGTMLIVIQGMRLWHQFFPRRDLARFFDFLSPFHLVNRYTIFANMTTVRYEVVVEGSEDGVIWKEYLFKYKPSELTYRPRRVSPYQPRLDWQMWFLPFRDFESEEWFQSFLYHLLKGNSQVLHLLRVNPFFDKPPKYIRSLMYEYEFTSFAEKRETGNWWKRTLVGQYSPTMSLKI